MTYEWLNKWTADDLIRSAIDTALRAHRFQVDKQGRPYSGHILRVAGTLIEEGWPAPVVAAGVLHDVLEDTALEPEALDDYPVETVKLVAVLTHLNHEPYGEYIERIKAAGPEAIAVKRADIWDNQRRLEGLREEDRERLTRKYSRALEQLET